MEEFILLENVVAKFRHPCVLDLKMGTQLYADHADEAKKQRKMMKNANSTSQTLGTLLGGMQVG